MAAIINDLFRIYNAQIFKDSFSTTNHYMTLGRVKPWDPTELSPFGSDSEPPNPSDSVESIYEIWREMFGAKKIQAADVSIMIPRYDWTSGVVYDEYDSGDPALYQKAYYVLTDDFNVYKVISNNAGVASTVKPTGTATTIIQTGDGYRWKYMYTVSALQVQKFLTPQFIPVSLAVSGDGSGQADVQDTAVEGQIVSYRITNPGSGYTTAPSIVIDGDGTGAVATAVVSGGEVVNVLVTNVGQDYTWASITLSGGGGSGAEIVANLAPKGGHGKNAIEELGGYYVAMAVRFEYDEGGKITTENDYRRISIIRNPNQFGSLSVFTGAVATQLYELAVASALGFQVDEVIEGATSGATASIVEVDTVNNILKVNDLKGEFVSENVQGTVSLATTALTSVTNPDLDPFSGSIVYTETTKPQPRNSNQVERIISIVEW